MYSKWKQLANKRITNACLKRLSGYVFSWISRQKALLFEIISVLNQKKIHFLENF